MAYVRNLLISIPASQFGKTVMTDAMNHTRLFVNENEYEPGYDNTVFIPAVAPGDQLELNTRSSSWWGRVTSVNGREVRVAVEANGVFESIRNGLSGLLTWEIRDATYATVESSLCEKQVSWGVYVHTKAAADFAAGENGARDEIWRKLLAICAEVASPRPLPDGWGEPEVAIDYEPVLSDEDKVLLGLM